MNRISLKILCNVHKKHKLGYSKDRFFFLHRWTFRKVLVLVCILKKKIRPVRNRPEETEVTDRLGQLRAEGKRKGMVLTHNNRTWGSSSYVHLQRCQPNTMTSSRLTWLHTLSSAKVTPLEADRPTDSMCASVKSQASSLLVQLRAASLH